MVQHFACAIEIKFSNVFFSPLFLIESYATDDMAPYNTTIVVFGSSPWNKMLGFGYDNSVIISTCSTFCRW